MAQVKLNNKQYDKKDCLAINIGNRTYNMPLMNCMPIKTLRKISKDVDLESILGILSDYIPEEVIDELSAGDVKQIFDAWAEASSANSGLELGK